MKKEMWLIWKEPNTRINYKIGVLTYENNVYTFKYVNPELNDARKVGFNFYPGFDKLDMIYTDDRLFANIATRLPNVKRPDYLDILNYYNLDSNSTQMEILKATKGKLLTDNYEFVPSFNSNSIEFDIAGVNHCSDVLKCKDIIEINDNLLLELDSNNEYDEYAIKVILDKKEKYHIGYVPRYYSKQLTELLNKECKYSAMIKEINLENEFTNETITAFVKIIFNDLG